MTFKLSEKSIQNSDCEFCSGLMLVDESGRAAFQVMFMWVREHGLEV